MSQPLSKESIVEDRENETLNDADEYWYAVIKSANQFKKRGKAIAITLSRSFENYEEMVQEVKGGKGKIMKLNYGVTINFVDKKQKLKKNSRFNK